MMHIKHKTIYCNDAVNREDNYVGEVYTKFKLKKNRHKKQKTKKNKNKKTKSKEKGGGGEGRDASYISFVPFGRQR